MSKTLSNEAKFKILQKASGDHLTDFYPDNWESMTNEAQDQFLEDNAWEPLQDHPIKEVARMIASAADRAIEALENQPPCVNEGEDPYFLVNLKIFSGEYEKSSKHLVQAKDEKSALKVAFDWEKHHDDAEITDDTCDDNGEFVYRANSIVEVDGMDVNILKKYLT